LTDLLGHDDTEGAGIKTSSWSSGCGHWRRAAAGASAERRLSESPCARSIAERRNSSLIG